MKQIDQHCVNLTKPEEVAYWSRLLNVSPGNLLNAVKATGSNLLSRVVWFLKAEGLLARHFDTSKLQLK